MVSLLALAGSQAKMRGSVGSGLKCARHNSFSTLKLKMAASKVPLYKTPPQSSLWTLLHGAF